ncbi:hypothetical protein DQW50_02965 [Halorubrum sp. 48-1-W]|nr:hypothetical protein DQW50_02965 [Halorubrum sp. 48-1-W]
MILGPPVQNVHYRGESSGSERHAPGTPLDPISAARSDPGDRERAVDRRTGPSDRRERLLPDRDPSRSGSGDRSPDGRDRSDVEIERLEAEIERKDRHLRYVIERYERLLSEKDRKLSEKRSETTDDVWSAVRSAVASFFRGDR